MTKQLFDIRILLFSWSFLFVISSFSKEITLNSDECHLIGENISFFEDATNQMDFRDVLNQLNTFQQNTDPLYAGPASSSTFWFHFTANNQSEKELWIDINNANLTKIQFYKFNQEYELVDSTVTGCLFPDETRASDVYTFQFPVLGEEDTFNHHFLLGIQTYLAFEIPIYIGSYETVTNNRKKFDYVSVFFIGAVLLLLLYNFFIFLVTKDKIYLYYVAYLLAVIVIGTYLQNFPIIETLFGKTISYTYLDTWLWLIFATTGLFTMVYFDLRKVAPVFYKILMAEMLVFVLFGLANLFIPLSEIANYYQIAAVLFYITCLVIGYALLFRGLKRAKLYCIGWTGMMVGAILYLMVYNGYLPYNAFFRNISYYGTMFEILVFSIALGQRINQLRIKEKDLNKDLLDKNKELTGLNDSLDSFNYHVSHDLKTVLNNTRALTLMAEKYNEQENTEKIREILGKLRSVNNNGVETVQSFLSLGQVDTIFSEDNVSNLSLADEIDKIIERHNLSQQITVRIRKNEIGQIRIHEKALESIFLNLFTNTIKYNQKEPKAELFFLKEGEQLLLKYVDNGIGIDLDKYGADLFKPFQRANPGTDKEGNGVGLYLIKRILDNYGGTIEVQSELGQGTTFIIHLPKTDTNEM